MLSFQRIRKHQKWLWATIAVPVCIGFVFLFTPDVENRLFGQGAARDEGFGAIINDQARAEMREITRAEMRQASQLARLSRSSAEQVLVEKEMMRQLNIDPFTTIDTALH